ncbi:MAG: hypothetical protein P8N09_08860 [Planctomycetota bacterium]|nr:hypothetical protein [Planctomycetota bacterium]
MAKSRKNPTRGGGGSARKTKSKNAGFEVEEQPAEGETSPSAGASLETALVYVTFVALLAGLIMAQSDLASSYNQGLFGG